MDDVWLTGDLAQRVEDPLKHQQREPDHCGPVISAIIMPRIGSVWRVLDVRDHFAECEMIVVQYLKLYGQPSDWLFDSRLFKRIDGGRVDVDCEEWIDVPLITPKEFEPA